MSEVERFMAPGPWITRDLKLCVLASDYDALAAELAEAKEDRYAVTRQRNEALHRLDEYIALDAGMGATILELRARIRELEDALRLAESALPPNAPWGIVSKVRAALAPKEPTALDREGEHG
jgi:hypothetical protein